MGQEQVPNPTRKWNILGFLGQFFQRRWDDSEAVLDTKSGITPELDGIFRDAVACRTCFGKNSQLKAALIDVAQPRWIGERYFSSQPRIVIVLLNPAAGKGQHNQANAEFSRLIKGYRDHSIPISDVFKHQKREMPRWGNGKFCQLYLNGFGLHLSDIAFANIAWCAEKNDNYPKTMMNSCFDNHTSRLLQELAPDIIMLSGGDAHDFKGKIKAACPKAQIEPTLHYAHRKGNTATLAESARIKSILARARARRTSVGHTL